MNLPQPENPMAQDPAFAIAPSVARCADLPRVLAGAGPEAIEAAADSLATQLRHHGWQAISDVPGLRMYARNGRTLGVDQLLGMIASGYMSAVKWEATCAVDGLSELSIPVPAGSVAMPADGFVDPFEVAIAGGPGGAGHDGYTPEHKSSKIKRVVAIALAMSIFVAVNWYQRDRTSDFNDHLAGHVQGPNELEVPYDGKLSVDDGRATVAYGKQDHEFEVTDTPEADPDVPDVAVMKSNSFIRFADEGRNYMQISHAVQRKDLRDRANLAQWINSRNVITSNSSDRLITAKRTTMAGHTAWSWEWTCSYGCWSYAVRVPLGKHVYSVRCHLMPALATPEAKTRCKELVKNIKLNPRPA